MDTVLVVSERHFQPLQRPLAAAAPLVADWADRVDFFSLGTNDLIASALGQDRDDPVGAQADDALHPGLVRLIAGMIDAAHEARRPISACGEMAADPLGALVLTALGADSLSVAVDRIQAVREALASLPPTSRAALRVSLLRARSAEEVGRLVRGRASVA